MDILLQKLIDREIVMRSCIYIFWLQSNVHKIESIIIYCIGESKGNSRIS